MNEPTNDETKHDFERHLREFRPVAPRALANPSRHAPWGALAVAAAVLLLIAVLVVQKRSWHAREGSAGVRTTQNVAARVPRPVTLGQLNAALRASDQDLNQLLDDASPRLLPHEHRGTALFELSKE